MEEHHIVEVHAIFRGRVQGVGFRYTARKRAIQLKLTGTVCNLPDGTVELRASGIRKTLDQLIQLLREEVGTVDSVDIAYALPTQTFVGFQIIG